MIFLDDGAGEEFLQARLICCGIALIDPFQIRTSVKKPVKLCSADKGVEPSQVAIKSGERFGVERRKSIKLLSETFSVKALGSRSCKN
jgi:hypothetical protein